MVLFLRALGSESVALSRWGGQLGVAAEDSVALLHPRRTRELTEGRNVLQYNSTRYFIDCVSRLHQERYYRWGDTCFPFLT